MKTYVYKHKSEKLPLMKLMAFYLLLFPLCKVALFHPQVIAFSALGDSKLSASMEHNIAAD
jgi:hypothetical protein